MRLSLIVVGVVVIAAALPNRIAYVSGQAIALPQNPLPDGPPVVACQTPLACQNLNVTPNFLEDPILAPKARKKFDEGRSAFVSGDYEHAKEKFQSVYKVAPGNPAISFYLGVSCLQLEQLNQANTYLTRATSIDPQYLPAVAALGVLKMKEADYAGAEQEEKLVLKQIPHHYVPHWILADIYLSENRLQAALEQAQLALRLGKSRAKSATFLEGITFYRMGRKTDALKALGKFVHDDPGSADVPEAKSLILQLQK